MEKYYVSGCKDNGSETVTCDDSEAQFWTLYVRDDAGLSQGIIDCVFREDAEAAMAVYVERDALQEQVRALAAENVIVREQAEEVYAAGYNNGHLNTVDGIAYAPGTKDDFYPNALQVMAEVETPTTEVVLCEIRTQAVSTLPKVGDGKENEAFEVYARSRNLDLSQHPLHYLFLDGKTNQARSAWRECLIYVSSQFPAGEQP